MMEQFIEEIYSRANIIQLLMEICTGIRQMNISETMELWNATTEDLLKIIEETRTTDPFLSSQIEKTAYKAADLWRDSSRFTSCISKELIPLIYKYMSNYTGINVEDGKYTIQSADSGFLTVLDNEYDMYLHETHDPMWEARCLAENLWNSGMDEFHIFGAGLGYLAYQLWKISYGSTKIHIYESDRQLLGYARSYGVLDWIPDDIISITATDNISDYNTIYDRLNLRCYQHNIGHYITRHAGIAGMNSGYPQFNTRRMIEDSGRAFSTLNRCNFRINNASDSYPLAKLTDDLSHDNWVVAAAGPSLDDNIEKLKEERDNIRIVCVDVIFRKLINSGIKPDLVVSVDPKEFLTVFIEDAEEYTKDIPLLSSILTSWQFVKKWKGTKTFILVENQKERYSGTEISKTSDLIWNVGGTVASLALEAAIRFGAKKIWFAGLDLGYPGDKKQADGIGQDTVGTATAIYTRSVDGGMVKTTETFNIFRSQIEYQIAQRSDIEYYNLSSAGASISGTVPVSGITV